MTLVRMLVHLTGGRYDGTEWPGYMGEIDLPEWEAEHMVKGGTAEYPDAPRLDRGYDVLKVADPGYEKNLKTLDGEEQVTSDARENSETETVVNDADYDNDFEDGDYNNEVEAVTRQVKRPSTVDSKAAWIEWAVSNGADREKAAAKTKAMLIADY